MPFTHVSPDGLYQEVSNTADAFGYAMDGVLKFDIPGFPEIAFEARQYARKRLVEQAEQDWGARQDPAPYRNIRFPDGSLFGTEVANGVVIGGFSKRQPLDDRVAPPATPPGNWNEGNPTNTLRIPCD